MIVSNFNNFSKVYEIDFEKSTINQKFSVNVEADNFQFQILTRNELILLSIFKNDIVICDNIPIKNNFPLNIMSLHKFNKGYFFAINEKNNETNLNTWATLRLFYGIF